MEENQDIKRVLELSENELKAIFDQMSIDEIAGLIEELNEVKGND